MCVWGSGNSAVHLLKIPVAKWNTQAELSNGSQMLLGSFLPFKVPPFLSLSTDRLGDSDWGAAMRAGFDYTVHKCQKINAGLGNKVELDLICPRQLCLICSPFSTATQDLRKKCTPHSGCYGILSCNNLTSRWGGNCFHMLLDIMENLSLCIHAPFTSIHILSLLLLEFF